MSVPKADQRLLQRHAPELRYHVLEPYRADSCAELTDSFVRGGYSNELRSRDPDRVIARSAPTPGTPRLSLALLAAAAGKQYYPGGPKASKTDYLAAHEGTLVQDAQRLHALPAYGNVTYARVVDGTAGRRWLQYWLFYLDNPFHVGPIGRHQGDWEMVQIAVDAHDRPLWVTYAQHERGARRDWGDVTVVDSTHPVVYVAKGSHASYFDAGTHPRSDIPLGLGKDHTSDGLAPVRPAPRFLDPDVDTWLRWPGAWGATKNLIDHSPAGPAMQKERWERPEEFHAKAVDAVVQVGLEAEAAVVAGPPTPEVAAALAGDALRVDYAFPAVAEGATDPVRVEVAIHGVAGPPSVGRFDVAALRGSVLLARPLGDGPYRVELAAYNAEDDEALAVPIDVAGPASAASPGAPQGGGPAGGVAVAVAAAVTASVPGAAPPQPADAVRVVVHAPRSGPAAVRELHHAVAALAGGPWTVGPLFGPPDRSARELARFQLVSGPAPDVAGTDTPAATFALAQALASLGPAWTVEPDVPSSVSVPDPEEDGAALEDDLPPVAWALKACRLPEAWRLTQGAGVVIGQPDTGYTDHPELIGALDTLRDLDVLTGAADAHAVLRGFPPAAFPSHGTCTASVLASREPGQITGAAPLATVVPIRTAPTVIHVRNAELAIAVNYARTIGCHVISISMGGVLYPGSLRAAIRRAVADGVIVLAAAGQPLPLVVEPASYPECIAVGGTTSAGEPWLLSARGEEVAVSAPAKKVWVAATGNHPSPDQYHVAAHSGTSFAVALVAGSAALWLAHHGQDVLIKRFGAAGLQGAFRWAVRHTATVPPGWDTRHHGAGILNAEALLQLKLADIPVGKPARPSAPRTDTAAWTLARAAALAPGTVDAAARVAATLGEDDAVIAAHGPELLYRMAEHADVRAEVLAPAAGAAAARDSAALEEAPALVTGHPRLAALASPGLRAALSGE